MIALRTGCVYDSDGYVNVTLPFDGDFHFMRIDNGVWKQKMGSGPIMQLPSGKTPEDSSVWGDKYTSEVVYMIVRYNWWE